MAEHPPDLARELAQQAEALNALVAAIGRADGQPPERRQTQLSHLVLGRSLVYKLKKPVRRSFIDAGSLSQRRALCEKELAVNQVAGALYRGMVAIGPDGPGDPATLADPLDYAVVLQRFDEAARADRVLARGALDEATLATLARDLARSHGDAERASHPNLAGQIAANARSIGGELSRRHHASLGREALGRVLHALDAEIMRCRGLLDARSAAGVQRACHGDLHLENIVLLNGRPVPYDAIEFNDDLRFIDPWFDVAFTLTDLRRHGRDDLARAMAQTYVEASGDSEGQALLWLYQSVRALVRVLVLCDQGDRAGARAFFTLAQRLTGTG